MSIDGECGEEFEVQLGSPQGSTLSPLLFILYLSDLLLPRQKRIYVLMYADDIVVLGVGRSEDEILALLQPYIDEVVKYLLSNRLYVSVEKTVGIVFKKRFPRRYECPKIYIGKEEVLIAEEVKLLGMVFDKHLNFVSHVKNIVRKGEKNMIAMRRVGGTSFGCNVKGMIKLYKALILSVIMYGAEAYYIMSKGTMKKLESLQYNGLHNCFGMLRGTSKIAVVSESNELELRNEFVKRVARFMLKTMMSDSNVGREVYLRKVERMRRSLSVARRKENEIMFDALFLVEKVGYERYNGRAMCVVPWKLKSAKFDLEMAGANLKNSTPYVKRVRCEMRIIENYSGKVKVFTDASKGDDFRVGIAYYIQEEDKERVKLLRVSDNMSVFVGELLAMYEALKSVKDCYIEKDVVIFSDSLSAIKALRNFDKW